MTLQSEAVLAPARTTNRLPALTPSQKRTYDVVLSTIPGANVVLINGEPGSGKSLILQHLQAQLGGRILTAADGMRAVADRGPEEMEEALMDLIEAAHAEEDLVFFDDLAMFDRIGRDFADRPHYLTQLLKSAYDRLIRTGKRMVVTSAADWTSDLNKAQAAVIQLDGLGSEDYAALIGGLMMRDMSDFDADKLSRSFKKLSGYQIEAVANMLKAEGKLRATADDFVERLDAFVTKSNVDMEEVEDVSLDGLVGIDDIVQHLRRTVLIPMTEPELAKSLGLKPKRGVLLYGEPGTGKTTIGRALAHAMKGKFFMIDGTFIPGTIEFMSKVDAVLSAAEASSPSVIFIDDADVIFRGGQQPGFARKLLTKLDGLESETQSNVCIVMTAMDVSDLPPALLRSGRVEVWLETRLPDARKRAEIIRYYSRTLPKELQGFDEAAIVKATDGFTPADLRGLVADARGHVAYDRHKVRSIKSFQDYLLLASQEIGERKGMLKRLTPKAA